MRAKSGLGIVLAIAVGRAPASTRSSVAEDPLVARVRAALSPEDRRRFDAAPSLEELLARLGPAPSVEELLAFPQGVPWRDDWSLEPGDWERAVRRLDPPKGAQIAGEFDRSLALTVCVLVRNLLAYGPTSTRTRWMLPELLDAAAFAALSPEGRAEAMRAIDHAMAADRHAWEGDPERALECKLRQLASASATLGLARAYTLETLEHVCGMVQQDLERRAQGGAAASFEGLVHIARVLLATCLEAPPIHRLRILDTLVLLGRLSLDAAPESELGRAFLAHAALHWAVVVGPLDTDFADALDHLAEAERRRGRLQDARALQMRAIEIASRRFDRWHPSLLRMRGNLAVTLGDLGDARAAELVQVDVLLGMLGAPEPDDDQVLLQLHNLGVSMYERGRCEEALPLLLHADRGAVARGGPASLRAAELARDLGRAQVECGDLFEAERTLRRAALALRELVPAHDARQVDTTLYWALALARRSDPDDEVDARFDDALRAIDSAPSPDALLRAEVLGLWAIASAERADAASAIGRLESALRELRAVADARSISIAQVEAKYGEALLLGDAPERALEPLRHAFDVLGGRALAQRGSALDRARWSQAQGVHDGTAALVDALVRLGEAGAAFEIAERGFERPFLERLVPARPAASDARVPLVSAIDGESEQQRERRAQIEHLHGLKMRLELEWQAAEPDERLVLTPDELRASLEPGELVLRYAWWRGGIALVALPCAGEGDPSAHALASGVQQVAQRAREIAEALDLLRGADASPAAERERRLAERTAWLLPARLHPTLRAARRIVVLPDGPLHALPFEIVALGTDPNARSTLLFEAVRQVVHAPSASAYARARRTEIASATHADSKALVLSAAYIHGGSTIDSEESAVRPTPGWLRSEPSLAERLATGELRPLAGAEAEARGVAESFRAARIDVEALFGGDACLDRLEASVPGSRYVHLAAHALTGTSAHPEEACLVLDGCDGAGADASGALTLARLMGSWHGKLAGCELAVLSACESRVGIDVGGSHVALPWGFLDAGARAVMAGLWKVDDQATALLMDRFWQNLLETRDAGEAPTSAPEALSRAKDWLRTARPAELRRRYEALQAALPPTERSGLRAAAGDGPVPLPEPFDFSHPRFWAAFVLIGDAR